MRHWNGVLGGIAAALLLSGSAAASTGSTIADATEIGAAVQAVGADSFAGTKVAFPGGVTGYPDVTYATIAGYRPLKMDLFLPPATFAGPRPWVMYVHGGGWMGGGPRRSAAYADWPKTLAALAAQGYVVATVSYRFAREAPFPAAIQDVKAAIRWLKTNAKTYRLDPERGAIWGQSAGGHLAALAGVSCGVAALEPAAQARPTNRNVEVTAPAGTSGVAPSDCVQAVVAWFGIYEFPIAGAGQANDVMHLFLGCADKPCSAEQMKAASPISYVDPRDPPFLLIHGSADTTVPVAQTDIFAKALQAAGVPVHKTIIPGAEHSWIGKSPEATRDASRQALRETIDFIDATIGDKAARH